MSVWKLKPLARSRVWATGKEERMQWVRLYARNEKKRLEALHYLGDKWVYYKKYARVTA